MSTDQRIVPVCTNCSLNCIDCRCDPPAFPTMSYAERMVVRFWAMCAACLRGWPQVMLPAITLYGYQHPMVVLCEDCQSKRDAATLPAMGVNAFNLCCNDAAYSHGVWH